jgi:transketolase
MTFGELDRRAVRAARALPLQIVQDLGHGHAGTPMGVAPLAYVLYQRVLRHDPSDPAWVGRDRFVLSAGHASLLLYVQLFFSGYGLTLDDLAHDRVYGSRTPGHPERERTPGVEMSTGPLGQGVASATGMAIAARHEAALLDPEDMRVAGGTAPSPFDHTIWVLAGDGCLQEGVSAEASSLAGTLGLDNLVLLWDDNRITIDGATSLTLAEDVRARYGAYGWRVLEIPDVEDLDAVERVLLEARAGTGRPTLVAVRSTIGYPAPEHGGTPAAHAGPFGVQETARTKELLGFAPGATLAHLAPDDVVAHARGVAERGRRTHAEWTVAVQRWAGQHPDRVTLWRQLRGEASPDWSAVLDTVEVPAAGSLVATRTTNGVVLAALARTVLVWGGSADLSESTNVNAGTPAFTAADPTGTALHLGIREHAMAAVLTGIALHSPGWRPFGSTYLVFSDYMRPAIRLAALMRLPVVYVFTHDSLAVGEDGPTHQPVEQVAGLRTVPRLAVVRPADAAETVAAWRRVLAVPEGPTALVLSRQKLPVLEHSPSAELTDSVARGAYVLWQSCGDEEFRASPADAEIVLATGSEVHLALEAAREAAAGGARVRVVSVPCVEWFDAQPADYREAVLPAAMRARVAVEAGRPDGWWRYVGLDGTVVGVDDFGESGSGPQVMAAAGITVERIRTELARAGAVGAKSGACGEWLSGRNLK